MSRERSARSTRRTDGCSVAACVVLPTPKPITSTVSGGRSRAAECARARACSAATAAPVDDIGWPLVSSVRPRRRHLRHRDDLGEPFVDDDQAFVARAAERTRIDVVRREAAATARASRRPSRATRSSTIDDLRIDDRSLDHRDARRSTAGRSPSAATTISTSRCAGCRASAAAESRRQCCRRRRPRCWRGRARRRAVRPTAPSR